MTRAEIVEAVVDALRETQQMSGHEPDTGITEETVPIGDLDKFDSPNGVEATVALEERIGRPLPVNLFRDDTSHQPLSVGDIVDRLLTGGTEKET